MLSFRKLALAAAPVAALLFSVSPSFAEPDEINFGVISTEASSNQKKNWEPFVDAMSKALGVKVNAFYATDYAGVIEAMRFNKVQIAWYGNKSALEAVDRANGEVFAQTVSKDGSEGYYSHIIVHQDSPLQTLDDVLKCDKTLDFGIGDPNSTSGFLVPTTYVFAARKVDPKSCFKTVRNGSHEVNSLAVLNKQVNAATNNSEDLQRLEIKNPEGRAKIRVVWTSPIIPLDPIVWRRDLDTEMKTKIYKFLLSYGRTGSDEELAQSHAVLGNLLWSPFKPSSNDQLLPIRKLEANKSLMKIAADEKLTAEEKEKLTTDLKAKIASIEELEKKAETSEFKQTVAAFVAADKAGKKDEVAKTIEDLALSVSKTN
ncbi:alkylphosphonate ABC transporter substrate-binding protein [Rhodomicrobium udaipurense JA643]|uniref:Phosphonate ABC transporter substrate-binding protein n=1 Tax=Rhodomicrobium udaipurense TaxID=1202716 RepID=A0A8I1GFW4_9HYPH|nr:phosphonate ABC transporter substrate-binding protein [Rhodomicrobium udaipurense]KAI95092.1 alkylphosphonate ABC transporter substrate-binding protein [Rhodomicrobium udaipurense JA643]MBJ7544079.1 phosphonate ABC transporter substrate-binding protein [Rhodomicrobium udaipurense]